MQVTDAGLLTVQATNGISGVFQIMVGVTNFNNTVRTGVDTQIIPVYVNPPTPLLDLLPVSDTGSSDSDNLTRLNNSDTDSRLQFQVGNVVPGATVKIFAGTTLIGQATAPTTGGTSLTITTNGAAALLNGINNITATQLLPEVDVAFANFREENVVLTSAGSTPLAVTVDRTAPSVTVPTIPIAVPGQLLTIDIASNEEGTDGFLYALIQKPTGATINQATGVITWTPNVSQAGTHQFIVGATDKAGNTSQQQFEVKVNSPPQLQAIQNQAVGIGEELNFLVTTQDSDLPNDTLTYSLTNAPAGATITPAENFQGRFRWTPTAGQSGLHSVTVRVTDAAGQFSEQTIQITVDDPEPPQIDAIPDQTVDELAPFTFDANATDANLPNDTLTFSLVGTVPTGMTINAQTGVISWTPTEVQGPDSYDVTVRVTDAFELTDEDTFTLTVNEVNTPPAIPPIADKVVNAGSELRFVITATDADLPAQALGFSLVSAPAGALIDPLTGEFVWTPSPSSQASSETITIRVEDGRGGSAQQTFDVRVNVAPQLEPIADKTADEGQTLTVPAIATDANGVDDTLIYSLIGVAPPGASINPASGVITFTPTEGQGGQTLTITVRATDEGGLSAETSFDVTVNEVNADPVIAPIGDQRVNLGGTLTVDADATDSDVPQQTLVFSLDASAPAGAAIDPASGVITWTPNSGHGIGPHVFTVRVSDGVATVSRTFNVTVNVAPTLDAVTDKAIDEGAALNVPLVASDPNGANDTLTFSIQSGPTGASINAQTGVLTWTPSESQGPQSHSITVRVTDSGGLFAERTFNVQVNEVNSPPVIAAIGSRNVNEGSTLSFNVPATDPDVPANTLTYSVVGALPAGATLDPVTGAFSWTPSEAQGPQTFSVTVRVQDAGGASDEETFQIVVAEANTAPQLADIADQSVDEGSAMTFTASATDSDTPSNTIRFSLGAGAPAGAAIDPDTGVFTWTPSEAQGPGTFTISIVAMDAGGLSDTTTVAVTVREANTAPSISAVPPQTVFQGGILRVNVDAADADLPANALTFSLTDAPEGATIDPQTGEISWRVPREQTLGVLAITVQVRDAAGATAELRFEVEVQQFDITQLLGSELEDLVDEIQRNNFFEGVGGLGTLDLPAVQRGDALDPLAPITNGNPIVASTDRLQASNDVTLEQNAEEENEEDGERREVRRPSSGDDGESPQNQEPPRDLGFPNPFGESGTSAPADDEASVGQANDDLGSKSHIGDGLQIANLLVHSADAQVRLLAGLAQVAAGVFLAGVADSACVIELRHEPTADEYFEARGERFVVPTPAVDPVDRNSTSPVGIAVAGVAVAGPMVVAELAGRRAFYPPPPLTVRRKRRLA